MKKTLSLLITLAMLAATAVIPISATAETIGSAKWDGTTLDKEWSGTGAENDPYLITSAAELAGLANKTFNAISTSTDVPVAQAGTTNMYNAYTGKYFKLMCDVDLDNKEWTPIGRIGMRFNGNFDGNGHVVRNVNISNAYYAKGFFGATGTGVSIKNFGLENVKMIGNSNENVKDLYTNNNDKTYSVESYIYSNNRTNAAGALIGAVSGGVVDSCYVSGVEINNTNSGVNMSTAGCMFAAVMATAEWKGSKPSGFNGSFMELNKETVTTFTNCYIYDVEFAGNIAGKLVFGTAANNNSNYAYRSGIKAKNCYAAKVKGTNLNSSFFQDNHAGKEITDCMYSDIDTTLSNATKGTVDEVTKKYVNLAAFCDDNDKAPINGGYPVLSWQNTWNDKWDGTATDIVWDGEGTVENPYLITSAAELAGLAKTIADGTSTTSGVTKSEYKFDNKEMYLIYTDKYFELTKDIDLADNDWLPIGRTGLRFDGNFNGNGHVIKNLKISTTRAGEGLFGAIGENAKIKNIGVDKVDVKTNVSSGLSYDSNEPTSKFSRCHGMAGLVGSMVPGGSVTSPVISGCFVKNTVIVPKDAEMNCNGAGSLVGSVIGGSSNKAAYISNCYVYNADVKGHSNASAFLGNDNATKMYFTNCFVGGNVALTFTRGAGTTTGKENTYTKDGKQVTERTPLYNFGGFQTAPEMTNCFTSANSWWNCAVKSGNTDYSDKYTINTTYTTDPAVVAAQLVDGGDVWVLDNADTPVNGGYPVLAWEKYWTAETAPTSFYKAVGVNVSDGKVTGANVIVSKDAPAATVIVAVYSADGRFIDVSETSTVTNGVADVEDLTVESGSKVKVFVWNATQTPMCDCYETVVE